MKSFQQQKAHTSAATKPTSDVSMKAADPLCAEGGRSRCAGCRLEELGPNPKRFEDVGDKMRRIRRWRRRGCPDPAPAVRRRSDPARKSSISPDPVRKSSISSNPVTKKLRSEPTTPITLFASSPHLAHLLASVHTRKRAARRVEETEHPE